MNKYNSSSYLSNRGRNNSNTIDYRKNDYDALFNTNTVDNTPSNNLPDINRD